MYCTRRPILSRIMLWFRNWQFSRTIQEWENLRQNEINSKRELFARPVSLWAIALPSPHAPDLLIGPFATLEDAEDWGDANLSPWTPLWDVRPLDHPMWWCEGLVDENLEPLPTPLSPSEDDIYNKEMVYSSPWEDYLLSQEGDMP